MTPVFSDASLITLDHIPDIRLIACDMDGTLLDGDDAIHNDFWPLIETLHARGIVFCPASGRQYHSLLDLFLPIADELIFIAENGAYVVQKGLELSSETLPLDAARHLIQLSRTLKLADQGIHAVLGGKRAAYVEAGDERFAAYVTQFSSRCQRVNDLCLVDDEILKLAFFTPESSEKTAYPVFKHLCDTYKIVVSGEHWLDLMAPTANKGAGLRHVQEKLNITPDQTMVFGDFLNDLEMMDQATYSFAMNNAHPKLKERARFLSPENTQNGVVRTIKSVLKLA